MIPPFSSQTDQTRRRVLILSIIIVATVCHWLVLAFNPTVFFALRFWFFIPHQQQTQPAWIIAAVSALGLATAVSFSRLRPFYKLLVLMCAGTCIQYSLVFAQGQGLNAIRDVIVYTGHAEFASMAVQETSMLDVAQQYEAKVQAGTLGKFVPSKPPGSLLFYMLCERIVNGAHPERSPAQRLEYLRTFASLTWPAMSYLVLIPMFFFARACIGERDAPLACLLYLPIPSVNLITLHLDQTLFPLLGLLPVLLIVISCIRRNSFFALFSGVTFYIALYCSFGLLPLLLLIFAYIALPVLHHPTRNWKQMSLSGIAFALGFAAIDLIMRIFLQYDIVRRYYGASTYHESWKGWEGGINLLLEASLTNTVEFLVWISIPIGAASMIGIAYCLHRTRMTKKIDLRTCLSIAIVAIVIALLLFGHTKAETARLWMFLIPYLCIIAIAGTRSALFSSLSQKRIYIVFLLVLTFTTTYFVLRYQDFF